MKAQGLDGFLVPHEDEHQNEYLPAANDRLGWATGFTGSAGAAVILADKAAVFVDGRYTLQVRDQVDAGVFEIRDLVEGGVPAYLETAPKGGQTIGYDPRLHCPDALERLKAAAAKAGAALKPVAVNPLDEAWGAGPPAAAHRPGRAASPAVFRRGLGRQARPGRRAPWPPGRRRRHRADRARPPSPGCSMSAAAT